MKCSEETAFLFLYFTGSASDLAKFGEIKQIISFRNADPACPVVSFKLEFVTIHKDYKVATLGVAGHVMAAIKFQEDFFFFDSMGAQKGRMTKMAGMSFPPSSVNDSSIEFACYSRI
jgi:hypothetical protein